MRARAVRAVALVEQEVPHRGRRQRDGAEVRRGRHAPDVRDRAGDVLHGVGLVAEQQVHPRFGVARDAKEHPGDRRRPEQEVGIGGQLDELSRYRAA